MYDRQVHGRGRSTLRKDPGVLDIATGILGRGCTGAGQLLFLTWSDPFFLGDCEKSSGRASRAGWLAQDLHYMLWGCSRCTDSGPRGQMPRWGVLRWG